MPLMLDENCHLKKSLSKQLETEQILDRCLFVHDCRHADVSSSGSCTTVACFVQKPDNRCKRTGRFLAAMLPNLLIFHIKAMNASYFNDRIQSIDYIQPSVFGIHIQRIGMGL
jgi:hypothetical protein